MSEHTETPWKASGRWVGTDKHKSAVCECFSNSDSRASTDKSKANARHIVHCVNNMPKVVEALRRLVRDCDNLEYEAGRVALSQSDAEELLAALEAEKGGE